MKTMINGKEIDGRKVPVVIRRQPGYAAQGKYVVEQSTSGGYRLYKLVCDKWMDASLADVPELRAFCETGCK